MALSFFIGALLAIQGVSYVSSSLIGDTWNLIEEGEIEPFGLLLKNEILAEHNELHALGATVTAVSELAWPRPASGCGHSKLINTNVAIASRTASKAQINDAIDSYAVVLAQAVDNLRLLGLCCVMPSPWPTLENSCGDYGRIYEFERNWEVSDSSPSDEVICAARRLYLAQGARANNLGAAAGSAITDPAMMIMREIEDELRDYLRAVTEDYSGPCDYKSQNRRFLRLGGSLKRSIFNAAESVKDRY